MNRWYRILADEAGSKLITSHGARQTAASAYALQGASQAAIANLLGHTDTGATEDYTHVGAAESRPFVNKRWELMKGAGWGRRSTDRGEAGEA